MTDGAECIMPIDEDAEEATANEEGLPMNDEVKAALESGKVIDITTIGRKSGEAKRIEIWFHNLDGRIYITGRPGKRSWYANLIANPEMTFHLKEGVQVDLAARATAIRDEGERRRPAKSEENPKPGHRTLIVSISRLVGRGRAEVRRRRYLHAPQSQRESEYFLERAWADLYFGPGR